VRIETENRIPGTGVELTGRVAVTEDKRDYRPQMVLADEGQVNRAECTCPAFRKQGLKAGPCVHLIVLRLAYADEESKRAKGAEPRQAAGPEAAPAAGLDQRIEENVSENGANSQDVAFETWMSEQPWNRGSRGSGETALRAVVREAMAESRLRGRELSANGRESPGMAD